MRVCIINVNYSCEDYRRGLGEDYLRDYGPDYLHSYMCVSLGKITATIAGWNYCWMTCNVYIARLKCL